MFPRTVLGQDALTPAEQEVLEPTAITVPEISPNTPAVIAPETIPAEVAPKPTVIQDVLTKAMPILKIAGIMFIGNIVFPKKKGRRK